MKYVARRLAHGILLLLAVSFVAFAFAQLAPGDYFSPAGFEAGVSPETAEAWAKAAGLRRPFLARYAEWAVSAAHGNFGYSLSYRGPVGPLLKERLLATSQERLVFATQPARQIERLHQSHERRQRAVHRRGRFGRRIR